MRLNWKDIQSLSFQHSLLRQTGWFESNITAHDATQPYVTSLPIPDLAAILHW